MAIVYNDFQTKFGALPHQKVYFFTAVIEMLARWTQMFVYFGRCHKAAGFVVDIHKDDVTFAHLHSTLLLAERHKEVFHHTPVEERAVLVDPRHFEIGKVAHRGQRLFGGGHESFRLVEIDKELEGVARSHRLGDVGFWDENFAQFSPINIRSVVGETRDGEGVILANVYHKGGGFLGGKKRRLVLSKTTARFTKNNGSFFFERRVGYFYLLPTTQQGGGKEGGGEGKIIAQKHRKS